VSARQTLVIVVSDFRSHNRAQLLKDRQRHLRGRRTYTVPNDGEKYNVLNSDHVRNANESADLTKSNLNKRTVHAGRFLDAI